MANFTDTLNRLKKVVNNDAQFNVYKYYLYNVRVKAIFKLTQNLEEISKNLEDKPKFDLYAILVTGFLDKHSGIKEQCMRKMRVRVETQIKREISKDNGITFIDSELQNLNF